MAEIWTMGELLCEIMRPQAGIPLYEPGTFLGPFPSGAPAIFIDTAARLGHSCGIIGGVGEDDFGACLLNRLQRDGVDCSRITRYRDGSTGAAFVTYFPDGSRKFLYHFADTPATRPKAPKADALGTGCRLFHIMGCSLTAKKEFGREILKLAGELSQKGAMISFDPNIRPELMKSNWAMELIRQAMELSSILLPGVSELQAISGKSAIPDAVASCFSNPRIRILALKDGSRGCTVYTRKETVTMGVYPVEVRDATGAGDCFDAAFLCGILEGRPLFQAARMASAAAALNTAAFGPMEGSISREAIEQMISRLIPG